MYWPAFRTVHSTAPGLEVLEPGFYHRLETDLGIDAPEPHILSVDIRALLTMREHRNVDVDGGKGDPGDWQPLAALADELLSPEHHCQSRVVLDLFDSSDEHSTMGRGRPVDMASWARDSMSAWGDGVIDKRGYVFMPHMPEEGKLAVRRDVRLCNDSPGGGNGDVAVTSDSTSPAKAVSARGFSDKIGLCPEILRREMSNRACFNKCT